jgi:Matrixin
MIMPMKRTRVSGAAAGAALALTATVMTITPATGASSGQGVQAVSAVESTALALGRRKTKLKVRKSASTVVVLQRAKVKGKVSGPKRKVILQLKNAYGWRKVDKDKSNKKGKYVLKVPTKWYGKKKMRVVVPPTRRFQGKVKKVAVKVDEGYEPLGLKKSWTRLTQYKTRYNPCQKIKYAVNPSMLPADGVAILNEAVFRIELATGLRYKYSGTTKAIPFRTTKGKEKDRKANLAVAWTTPEADASNLGGGVLARGGFNGYQWVPRRRTYKLTKTGLLMDAGEVYAYRGFENGSSLGAVHMHELVHAAGMGHADDDPAQIMYPYANADKPALFGKGDITGLKKHGQDAGCLSRGNARVVPGSDPGLQPTNVPYLRGGGH